jgi:hypothetical protein
VLKERRVSLRKKIFNSRKLSLHSIFLSLKRKINNKKKRDPTCGGLGVA